MVRLTRLFVLTAPASALRVAVLGGSGFVGSRVCKELVHSGCDVMSVSQSGAAPAWCADEEWASSVEWKSVNLLRGARENIGTALTDADAIVSCVGAIGFDRQGLLQGNGKANVEAANAAPASVSRYVLVSVASEVEESRGWLPGFFTGYFDGKQQAEEAIAEAMADDGKSFTLVKPSFIYGGDSFGLFPPRVTTGYGSAIEELLTAGPISALADALPGLLKVALRPPVSVEAVAGACAKAALGEVGEADLDGTKEINAAAGQPAATGLSDLGKMAMQKVEALKAE